MKKEEFSALASHRYGPSRPMSGQQLDSAYFTPIKPLPREQAKALGPSIRVNTGPALQPRPRDLSICAECGGTGIRVIKVSSVGTKTYSPCKH